MTLCCSSDLFFGFPCLMCPRSDLSFIRSFSASSKVMSPLCMLLKICSAPLKPVKSIGALFQSLKVYFKLLKSILAEFFISASLLKK